MVVRSFDGRIAMSGKDVALAIPNTGEVRYEVLAGKHGGRLDVLIPDGETGGGQVVLLVQDGKGEYDELVVTEPRVLVMDSDGRVKLTLSEYVQVGNALSGIGAKLSEFEGRIAVLETQLSLLGAPALVTRTADGTTYPSGEEG